MLSELRFSARTFVKSPGFTLITVLTLAVGVGANTAIFSVLDAVVLRPLSYRAPESLVAIQETVPKFAKFADVIPVNGMHFLEWRARARSFEDLALMGGMTMNLTGGGDPERVPMARASSNLFRMLGVKAQIGRTFLDEEDRVGRDSVVVLDDSIWRTRFSADPHILGRKILLNGKPFEVIGVLPADFRFPKLEQLYAMKISEERPQIWKPFAFRDDERDPMGDFNFACIGRLKPGATLKQAEAELNVIDEGITRQMDEKIDFYSVLVPLQSQIGSRARTGLELLLAAVGVVLLIGCVNVANLLLVRVTGRRREIAIRSAVGASNGQLFLQMLAESLLLSGFGGAAGIGISFLLMRVILRYAPAGIPRLDEVRMDGRILLFALGVSLLSGLLFGILPALAFARADPQEALKAGARGSTEGRGSGHLRSSLVAGEVGLSAMCLIAAGLLLHSFLKLMQADRGFETEHVVTVDLNLPNGRYADQDRRSQFLDRLVSTVAAIPGVTAAGVSNVLPLAGEGGNDLVQLEGQHLPFAERPVVDIRQVNADYFHAIGIPLREGRMFVDADRNRQIAVVSAITASRLWPGQNPIGKRLSIGDDHAPLLEVIGVVGDVRAVSLNVAPTLTLYEPYWQQNRSGFSLVTRTAMDASSATGAIRRAIRNIDPELPVPAMRTMEERVAESVSERRFQMDLVLLFAIAALLLASLGIYGVISYSVAQRSNEMGIRMALGAGMSDIRRMVLRQSLLPVAMGLAVGVTGSLSLGRLMQSMLSGVTAADPWTMGIVVATLVAVAAAASYLPAVRATHVDPSTALRYE
jgi:putative ABC transport system permease protein